MRFKHLALAAAGFMMTGSAFAALVPGFNSNTLAGNDDGYTDLVSIGFTVNFFGQEYSKLYVNNNGNVTFDYQQGIYTPYALEDTHRVIIAPFFADVDTSNYGSPVTYGTGTYNGQAAFGVNWQDVSYYGSRDGSSTNSFQLILVDRSGGNFDIIYNYDNITWETGTASGGSLSGLGGYSARVGWSNGTNNSYELAGSGVNGAFLNGGPNSLVTYNPSMIFHVVNGEVSPPTPAIPEPETWAMLLAGLGIVGTLARRHRV